MALYLYGASGHGAVIADIIAVSGKKLSGFVDDDPRKRGTRFGHYPVLGPADVPRGASFIVAIGDNSIRAKKAAELEDDGFRLTTAIHPSSVVASDIKIGAGSVVMAGAVINPGASIGRNVIVNTGATIDHDSILEDCSHISPGVRLAGNVHVGRRAHIGIGAVVIPGIRVGRQSIAGAGAVVIRDIPDGCTHVGNPARDIRQSRQSS